MEQHLSTLMGEAMFNNQAEAYKLYSQGKVSTCPIQTLGQFPLKQLLGGPNAQTCVKTGYIQGATVSVVKVSIQIYLNTRITEHLGVFRTRYRKQNY